MNKTFIGIDLSQKDIRCNVFFRWNLNDKDIHEKFENRGRAIAPAQIPISFLRWREYSFPCTEEGNASYRRHCTGYQATYCGIYDASH